MTSPLVRRQVGEVGLSPLSLGTMRLSRAGNASKTAGLLQHALTVGMTSIHCSSEYETFPLLREAWQQVPSSERHRAQVVAKIAAPHFGEDRFSASAFRHKIEAYLQALSIERLDVVQWLLRYDLKNEWGRMHILDECSEELAETLSELQQAGKIGACVSFPYTAAIAERLVEAPYCDGLALYVNPLEREMNRFIEQAGEAGKAIIAIRPFAGGRLFAETSTSCDEALAHVFQFAPVATAVVSASTREHIDDLMRYFATTAA